MKLFNLFSRNKNLKKDDPGKAKKAKHIAEKHVEPEHTPKDKKSYVNKNASKNKAHLNATRSKTKSRRRKRMQKHSRKMNRV